MYVCKNKQHIFLDTKYGIAYCFICKSPVSVGRKTVLCPCCKTRISKVRKSIMCFYYKKFIKTLIMEINKGLVLEIAKDE